MKNEINKRNKNYKNPLQSPPALIRNSLIVSKFKYKYNHNSKSPRKITKYINIRMLKNRKNGPNKRKPSMKYQEPIPSIEPIIQAFQSPTLAMATVYNSLIVL